MSTLAAIDVVVPCYNVAASVERTLRSVVDQRLPPGTRMSIFAVDDGSTDGTGDAIARIDDPRVVAVRSNENVGRAAGINRGAAAGSGDVVMILDADCVLKHDRAIADHLRTLATFDVSIGTIRSAGNGFWSEYQNRLVRASVKSENLEQILRYTTANAAIRRQVFEAVGGFDAGFRYYGFEDKDFLARLVDARARIALTPDAVAVHEDKLTLLGVCGKLQRAAQYSAARMISRAPSVYYRTPYAKLDARLHGWLRVVPTSHLVTLLIRGSRILESTLEIGTIPFAIRQGVARGCMALCYLHGTRLDALRRTVSPQS